MWFIFGMLAGMAISEGDAKRLCPDLNENGCGKEQHCLWKPEIKQCEARK